MTTHDSTEKERHPRGADMADLSGQNWQQNGITKARKHERESF
jgi:hypothetical protein